MAGEEGLWIGVLGPLLGTRDGVAIRMPHGRSGVLLAALAMSAGHPVGVGRLAELIWPEERPERVRSSVQSLVARLRPLMPGVIVTAADGYLLDIDQDRVDLLRFRRLVREADAAETAMAMELLNQALELWRGEPLGDLRSDALHRGVIPELIEEHLSALGRRAALDLAAGRHGRVIAQSRALIGRYRLHEPLWGQLIRALVAAGRPAEAIQQYHRAREILAEELGIDPSPDLQDLYEQLLRADRRQTSPEESPDQVAPKLAEPEQATAMSIIPRQLPAGVVGFAGRSGPLKLLSEHADEAEADPSVVVISAVGGMAGVGKTALAVHWAHREAARFPDGQLYADLRGFDPSGAPALPEQVIRGFLVALGVPPARIPAGLDAQAGLYRTLLAGRRILLVLDNARDAAQVRPLLPGSPGCMAVITSRSPLTFLAAGYGARLLSLDVMTDGEATELLSARLGGGRVAAERETAEELVALCGRLPLALAITAARAAVRPGLPLSVFAGGLRDTRLRLDALDAGDPAGDLRTVFSWSYRRLSDEAADLFRLLGVHPGPDISLPAAASLAGTKMAQTKAAMRELTELHLVTGQRSGRYVLHDLVRAYAAEQASAATDASQRQAAICRALDHYLHSACDADALLSPSQHPIAISPLHQAITPERFNGRQQAMAWFDAEHQVLLAMTALAASTGFDAHAWQLPATFFRHLDRQGHWDEWAEVQRTALAAARRLGDTYAQACVLRTAGLMSVRLNSYREARGQYEQALRLFCDLDDPLGQARAHGDLSTTFSIEDRYREALAHSERAVELSRSAGHPQVQAVMLNKVGWHAAHLGDYQRALACCEQALGLLRELGNRYSQAYVWDSLGYIHHHLGHPGRSAACYHRAIELFREIGNLYELAATLSNLADASRDAGQPAAARHALQQAHTILNNLHHPEAPRLQAELHATVS